MRSLCMKTPNVLPSPVRAMGGSPVISKNNSNNTTTSNPKNHKNWKQSQDSSQPGGQTDKDMPAWKSFGSRGRSRGRGRGGQPGHGTRPAKEQSQYTVNDNYCLTSPVLVARPVDGVLSVQRQKFHVSVQQSVLCTVVSPVPFVLNVRGQSQKKDKSPSSRVKTEINFVKSVFL